MKPISCLLGDHRWIFNRGDGEKIVWMCERCKSKTESEGPEAKYDSIRERYLNAIGNRPGDKHMMSSEWEFFWIMSKIYEEKK